MSMRAGACLLVIFLFLWLCPDARAWDAYVVRVEDGNTVSVSEKADRDEPTTILRFYGIDAPSLSQPFGPDARDFLLRLMPKGTKVGVDSVGEDDKGAVSALVQGCRNIRQLPAFGRGPGLGEPFDVQGHVLPPLVHSGASGRCGPAWSLGPEYEHAALAVEPVSGGPGAE